MKKDNVGFFGTLSKTVIVKMPNIEAVKKSRKTERAAFTKAYNRVEELIALVGIDI